MSWKQQARLDHYVATFLTTLPGPAMAFLLSPTDDPDEFTAEVDLGCDGGTTIGRTHRVGRRWAVRQYGFDVGRARDPRSALRACTRAYPNGVAVRLHLIGEDFQPPNRQRTRFQESWKCPTGSPVPPLHLTAD